MTDAPPLVQQLDAMQDAAARSARSAYAMGAALSRCASVVTTSGATCCLTTGHNGACVTEFGNRTT